MNKFLSLMVRNEPSAVPRVAETPASAVPLVKGWKVNRSTGTAVLKEESSTELTKHALRNCYQMAKATQKCMDEVPEFADIFVEIMRRKAMESMQVMEDCFNDW